jgi:hypothetical protein
LPAVFSSIIQKVSQMINWNNSQTVTIILGVWTAAGCPLCSSSSRYYMRPSKNLTYHSKTQIQEASLSP